MKKLLSQAASYLDQKHRRSVWMRVVCGLGCIVVFCTVYALILPAITLTNDDPQCGLEEHAHDASCYAPKTLVCTVGNDVHQHSDTCYDADQNLTCGYADYVIHTHDAQCYDSDTLVCTLQEPHTHEQACYKQICTLDEVEAHTHDTTCYDENNELICGKQEIQPHVHTDACYADGNLVCGQLEVQEHQHTQDCVAARALTCAKEAHSHSESCYANNGIAVANTVEDIRDELAAQGIYPGTVDNNGVWTAYDAGNSDNANIKATITLPAEAEIADDHYLYIRAVAEDEGYYPTQEALDAMAGVRNDVQCYAIHWVRIYEENGEWKYDLNTSSVLSEAYATINIEYLKNDVYLKGKAANRKLQVYNSRQIDGSVLEEAGIPTGVTANDEAYTGFTFQTNRGGPYVFVSKHLYEGYVSPLLVNKIIDGIAPFDENDDAGNDSGNSNKIVRSYDTIQYDLNANFCARSSTVTAKTAEVEVEMTMDADVTEAIFDTSQMLWLGTGYTIAYLDQDGKVVLTQKDDGTYVDADGKPTTLNDIVSGSTNGTNSYTTNIVKQRLRGSVTLTDANNILAGTRTFSAAVQVLNADNRSSIQPTFKMWFKGNEDNYGSESIGESTETTLAQKVTDNQVEAEAVTVSTAARFNLELAKNSNVSYKSWFDSSTGKEVNSSNRDSYTVEGKTVTGAQIYALLEQLAELKENEGRSNPEEFTDINRACTENLQGLSLDAYDLVFQNIRYGRMTGYGITLQVYNKATGNQSTASKGFKGVSLPQGDINFDLNLETSIKDITGSPDPTQYYPQLWEYNENVTAESGNQNKNMYWAELGSTQYAAWAAPYNGTGTNADSNSSCYMGGSWKLGSNSSYSFTVGGYDFNFLTEGLQFPTHRAGNSSATDGYNAYIGCFSAGYIQVLNVLPRYQAGTLSMNTSVTVKNLAVNTTDGWSISTGADDTTGYAHEINMRDNVINDNIPLYARGGMTKANAFCTAALFNNKNANFTTKENFLGTDFWGTSYDCSAFAGQDITLVGAARINAGDYQIRHMNILQLFDSEALSIIKGKTPYVMSNVKDATLGEQKILYAVDPDHQNGYDTNDETVMEYMSTVREEDLIYYESLGELEADGYTCVGVMAEVRNCAINGEGGYSTALKIPMKVSEDEKFLTKTVGTVNTVRIWTNASDMEHGSVSWKDGVYNPSTGKNSVAGYTSTKNTSDAHYAGEVANGTPYEKTEYSNGQVVLGSNTGGYVYGSSLLILNYKSNVDIEVSNGESRKDDKGNSFKAFDLDVGNYTVNYRLQSIIAKVDDTIGQAQEETTNLTVLSKLDTSKREEGETDQRIAVAAGSYRMIPASDKMALTDENGNELHEQSMEISSDSNNPTTVHYAFRDPSTGEIDTSKIYTIQVYAQRDTNGTQVTFELKGVTIDISVPDITFDADIQPDTVKNNDRIQASAYISGTSDVRAYSDTAGNMDSTTIGIIQLTSTRLVKAVDTRYIELDDVFTYTVTYTNSGNESVDFYLYDLLPDPDDIRDSQYDGEAILREVSANLSGEDENFTAEIEFYYSKTAYTQLYKMVKVFGGNEDGTGRNTENIEKMLADPRWFTPLGTISSENNHAFQISDALKNKSNDELTQEMREMTGIYAVVKNLSGGKSLSINLTIEANGSNAGNLYRNLANSWLGDASEPLTSNLVETSVLAREISGVVWYDSNLNGKRDSGEQLIPGVTATLFKKNASGTYEPCVTNVRCKDACKKDTDEHRQKHVIQPVTTGEDGAYQFSDLAPGEYVVAFSGEALKDYTGATTYQVNGENDSTTNDAVALISTQSNMDTGTSIDGIDSSTYSYAIAYSLTGATREAQPTVHALPLHTIDEIISKNIPLTNDVERYENQDLGLVNAGPELPETGGSGTTTVYMIGTLLAGGAGYLLYRKTKKRKEARGTTPRL